MPFFENETEARSLPSFSLKHEEGAKWASFRKV